jgi:PAS domain S-box-containing protein
MRRGEGVPWREAGLLAIAVLPVVILTLLIATGVVIPRPVESLCLALALVWLVLWLAGALRRLVWQLHHLAMLLRGLRVGDYSLRAGAGVASLAEVSRELNALAVHLGGEQRCSLETDALLAQLLAALDLAVLIVDAEDQLVDMNPAAEPLLGGAAEALLGRSAAQLGLTEWLTRAAPFIEHRDAGGGEGPWEVRRLVFRRRGRPHRLLVVTDVSRALREQERHAWRRLIRVLSHEINNSLGSIQSAASLLKERCLQTDPTMISALDLIERRSEALGGFIRRYAELARLPSPSPESVEVSELIHHVVSLEGRVPVSVEPSVPATVRADPVQLEQALINLVRNAADAALETQGAVRVRWGQEGRNLRIEVEDDGPGLAHTENLFVPFFTTKPGGSGVGLALASQIIEAHGGSLRLGNRQHSRGATAIVRLPSGVLTRQERS